MSLYQNNTTGEVRDIDASRISAWTTAGNPKAAQWQAYTPPPPPEPLPPEVPWAISNAELRDGIINNGINPALVTAYINGLPDGQEKWKALNAWEQTNYVERNNPLLNALAPAFGLTSAQIDAIFLACPPFPRGGLA
jgi:hypothetical protein